MSKEPLLLFFSESGMATYVCYNCGDIEEKNCATEKKFKSFIKEKISSQMECLKCNSKLNLFRSSHGQQYWINI